MTCAYSDGQPGKGLGRQIGAVEPILVAPEREDPVVDVPCATIRRIDGQRGEFS